MYVLTEADATEAAMLVSTRDLRPQALLTVSYVTAMQPLVLEQVAWQACAEVLVALLMS